MKWNRKIHIVPVTILVTIKVVVMSDVIIPNNFDWLWTANSECYLYAYSLFFNLYNSSFISIYFIIYHKWHFKIRQNYYLNLIILAENVEEIFNWLLRILLISLTTSTLLKPNRNLNIIVYLVKACMISYMYRICGIYCATHFLGLIFMNKCTQNTRIKRRRICLIFIIYEMYKSGIYIQLYQYIYLYILIYCY